MKNALRLLPLVLVLALLAPGETHGADPEISIQCKKLFAYRVGGSDYFVWRPVLEGTCPRMMHPVWSSPKHIQPVDLDQPGHSQFYCNVSGVPYLFLYQTFRSLPDVKVPISEGKIICMDDLEPQERDPQPEPVYVPPSPTNPYPAYVPPSPTNPYPKP